MTWQEFRSNDPELAALGEQRLRSSGLVLLGSPRKNGWPRISPVEPLIAHGHLYLGMMWRSRKALDLLRDPRCTVHSTVSDRHGTEGEFKVHGLGVEVWDPVARQRYGDALYEEIGFRPEEPKYHLFSMDIQGAAYGVIQDGEWLRKVWRAGGMDQVREQ